MLQKEFEELVSDYFEKNNWRKKKCPICKRIYFTKKESETCASFECTNTYLFKSFSK